MTKEVWVEYLKEVDLGNPILIEGLPGFGLVGKLAAEHLINELKAEKFAMLYSHHFPPQVVVSRDGVVKPIVNEFYAYKGKKKSLILVIGDAQCSTVRGQYLLAETILDIAEKYGTKMIFTLGGYATGKLKEHPKVYGAATSIKLVRKYEKYGIIFRTETERGGIIGASGLLLGLGKRRGMEGVCLMGETPGHPLIVDAKAAACVLKVLTKILGIKVSIEKLERKAREVELFRETLEDMMRRALEKSYIKEREEIHDQLRYIG